MIYEVADFRIDPAKAAEFEAAIEHGVRTVIAHARGFIDWRVQRCIENPARYLLILQWQTLENHTVDFRGSDAFAQWRAIVGPFFTAAPVVEHFEAILPR